MVHDVRNMRANERFRFVFIVGLIAALLTAGISLAGDAIGTSEDPQPSVCEPTDDAGGGGTVVEGDDEVVPDDQGEVIPHDQGEVVPDDPSEVVEGSDEPSETEEDSEEPVDEGETNETADEQGETEDPGDGGACDDTTAADEGDQGDAQVEKNADASPQEWTRDDCLGAAQGEEPQEGPVPGQLHGLENAVAHVLWNCLDHPNHGLVNALTKLHGKLDAWLERREEREAARAEREAARAERGAARAVAKAASDAAHVAAKVAREAAKAARGHGGSS